MEPQLPCLCLRAWHCGAEELLSSAHGVAIRVWGFALMV